MYNKSMKRILGMSAIFFLVSFIIPVITFAQGGPSAVQVIGKFYDLIRGFIWLIMALALLTFLWSVFRYAFSQKEDDRKHAKQVMVWGIIALFVMVSIWGLVYLIKEQFLGGQRDGVELLSQETNQLQADPRGEPVQLLGGQGTVQYSTSKLVEVLNSVIPYLISLGALLFIWGVFNYIREENVQKKAQAAAFIGWGIVLLFIMSFMWVLVIQIGKTLHIDVENRKNVDTQKVQIDSLIKR